MPEAGYPGVIAQSWFAFFVPAKTPRAAIDWLNRHANEAFSDPAIRDQFQRQGLVLPLGTPSSSASTWPRKPSAGARSSARQGSSFPTRTEKAKAMSETFTWLAACRCRTRARCSRR